MKNLSHDLRGYPAGMAKYLRVLPLFSLVLAAWSMLVAPGPLAHADIFRADFTAQVDSIFDNANLLNSQVTVGQIGSGYFQYNTGLADQDSDPTRGEYSPAIKFQFQLGNYTFRQTGFVPTGKVVIVNDQPYFGDTFFWESRSNTSNISEPFTPTIVEMELRQLESTGATVFSNDALPLALFLSDFDNGHRFFSIGFDPGFQQVINLIVTSLSTQLNPPLIDFVVTGERGLGGLAGESAVNSLTFLPGGVLTVYDTVTVLQSPVSVVAGSALRLDGTLSADQLNILWEGMLDGNGSITGSLFNAGLVSPGNSPGKIHVTGNYTQAFSGTLRIEIGGNKPGQFDLLQVGGRAQIDGTLQLVRLNNFKLRRGDRIAFLTAGQGVEGEFTQVQMPFTSDTILQPTVIYDGTSVALEMVQGSFAKFAKNWELTPNQRAVARALDSVVFDPHAEELIAHLDERKLEKLPADFDRIAPEELTSIFATSTALAQVQSTNLQRRADDLRSGVAGFSAGALAMNGTAPGYSGPVQFRTGAGGPTGSVIRDGKEAKDTKNVEAADKHWGAFVSGVGEWVNVGDDRNSRGYDLTTSGFTLGLDYKISPGFAIGIVAGYAGTGVDLAEGGRVLINGGKLGIYATTFKDSWYADAAVIGGYNSYDTKRNALQGSARGSTRGGELDAFIGTGYDWKLGVLSIGPTAIFSYTHVGIDDFFEHGSLAPVHLFSRDAESVRTSVGIRASCEWKLGRTLIKPELRIGWQHEYADRSYSFNGTLARGASDHFTVDGPAIGRDSLLLGTGFAMQCSEACSTYIYYDGEMGRARYDRHAISGGIRVAF